MDVLSDVLASSSFHGVLLAQMHGHGDQWGCSLGATPTARFHLMGHGLCWLKMPNGSVVQLSAGDVVLLPHGSAHQLLGSPNASALPYEQWEQLRLSARQDVVELGKGGPLAQVVCGKFQHADAATEHPILSVLPEIVHVPGMAADPHLQTVIHMIATESTQGQPGSQAVATRLTEVLFTLLVRNWLARAAEADTAPSWLTALRDPRIGTALTAMHEDAARDWSLEGLAHSVSMSRPAFARQFKSLVGDSPLSYLGKVRLERAARMLRDSDDSLAAIARSVGYSSEFSFSRAFTRERGVAPSRYRRSFPVAV